MCGNWYKSWIEVSVCVRIEASLRPGFGAWIEATGCGMIYASLGPEINDSIGAGIDTIPCWVTEGNIGAGSCSLD